MKNKEMKMIFSIAAIALLSIGSVLMVYAYIQNTPTNTPWPQGNPILVDVNKDNKVDWHDYDTNNDGVVNMKDQASVIYSYNTRSGDAKWNTLCDFNGDGIVGSVDLQMMRDYLAINGFSVTPLFDFGTYIGQEFIGGLVVLLSGAGLLVFTFVKYKKK